MASALYSEDLTCSICLTFFTDPVTLPCGHSFCRGCVTAALSAQELCPQCRTAVPTEGRSLPTSHILKSLSEKAKDEERRKTEQSQQKIQVAELCPEHDEKLKLFCVTDQQLACIICRDGEKHEGHRFKPIKEAAAALRQELEKGTENLCGDVSFTESLADSQREEITKTKAKSQQLMTQIHRQFEEMHQFLRKREDEIKNELKLKEEDAAEKMSKNLKVLETALCESRELEGKLASVMKIEDPEKFLKRWTEGNSRMTPEKVFQPRATDLQVVRSSLCLGPYESHLQFFMWKEMLQVIQPRAELLSLKSNSKNITVSDDGRTLFCTTTSNQTPSSGLFSDTQSGQTKDSPFSFATTSGLNFGTSFGSTSRQGQTFGSLFGSTTTSGLNVGTFYGSTTTPGKTFGGAFGSTTGSRQTTTPAFGEVPVSGSLFGQTNDPTPPSFTKEGATHTNPEQCEDSSLGSSSSTNHAFSVNEFMSGQHYWEVEVGHRDYWELGIKDNFLKYDGQQYSTCIRIKTTDSDLDSDSDCDSKELVFENRPRKIGLYLNCASKKLSFYDADNMKHIHTVSSSLMSMPLSAYFNISATEPDHNPLTVCWY